MKEYLKKYFMRLSMETPMVLNIRFSKELRIMQRWKLPKEDFVLQQEISIIASRWLDVLLCKESEYPDTHFEEILYSAEYGNLDGFKRSSP
jgi:hypothetical protein